MIGAIKVLATYSTCTSHENSAELCAGKVFGPNLEASQLCYTMMALKIAHRMPKLGKL